jgi:hypothetical protein
MNFFNEVCNCHCHDPGAQVKHIIGCCSTCVVCHKRIRTMNYSSHLKKCQTKREEFLAQVRESLQKAEQPKPECEHDWVMDGHNAGDPICSKCYKRE